ncbi:MAG: RpiB/LacA/LacB family sugar-phosphate isomerase [Candidatus Paceibacterota bacterium]
MNNNNLKIYLSTDHAGFDLCHFVVESLKNDGYDVEYLGPDVINTEDDYPLFIKKAADQVSANTDSIGIVFGGSGTGEAIVANKTKGIRCALYYGRAHAVGVVDAEGNESHSPYEIVKLARLHNDANMLSVGARFVSKDEAVEVIKLFLETEFENKERHVRRISEIE